MSFTLTALAVVQAAVVSSPQGEIAFMRDGRVSVLEVETEEPREIVQAQHDRPVTWSPDGKHIIWWDHRSGGWDLWRCDADGSNAVNLTPETEGGCRSPSYSPDGSQIAFMRDGPNGLWLMNADGSEMRQLSERGHRDVPPQWSADGTRLLFCDLEELEGESRTIMRIRLFDLESGNDRPMVTGEEPQWVDDERFIFVTRANDGPAIHISSIPEKTFVAANELLALGEAPAVSPDRLHVAFVRKIEGTAAITHEIRCVDLDTGIDRLLRRTVDAAELDLQWSPDSGSILVWDARQETKGMAIIDATTGVEIARLEGTFSFPAWRPTGFEPRESQ